MNETPGPAAPHHWPKPNLQAVRTTGTTSQLRRRAAQAAVLLLLLLYVYQAVSATTQKSNTFDEAEHLTTGYLYWVPSGEKLNPGVGVFAQAWAALPLRFDHLNLAPGMGVPPPNMTQWELGYRFFYLMGNDPAKILLQARFMISLLGAALGALVFLWSRELFGPVAGLVSLFLFVFCPTMLAHGALVTADMAAALGFFAATFCFWRLTHTVSIRNLSLSLLALGCLALAKMSSFLIIPVFVSILLVRILSKRPVELRFPRTAMIEARGSKAVIGGLMLLAHALAVAGILWLAYRFNYVDFGERAIRQKAMDAPGFPAWSGQGVRILGLETLSRLGLLPPAYVEGLSFTLRTMPRGGSLLGSHSGTGSVGFFPIAFLIKTPISTLVLIALSLLAFATWKRSSDEPDPSGRSGMRRPGLYDLSPLLILGGVYGMACLSSGLNIGHRHMMPLYPVLFVLAGANAFWLRHPRRVFQVAILLLLGAVAAESLCVRPHYLAFFNRFVGGPSRGYRYLVDSSLDWGQDLPGLRQWLDRSVPAGGGTRVFLSYFGTGDPEFYGIKALRLPSRFGTDATLPVPLQAGVYCISATSLQAAHWTTKEQKLCLRVESELAPWDAAYGNPAARSDLLRQYGKDYWTSRMKALELLQFDRLCECLRLREPDDEVGYSILIYRLSDGDLTRALDVKPQQQASPSLPPSQGNADSTTKSGP